MLNEIILPDGFDQGEVLFPEEVTEEAQHETDAPEEAAEDPIEAQNEAAAAKAPVRGVSGGCIAVTEEKSLFEQGFDAASHW